MDGVFIQNYPPPTIDESQALRYAGCKTEQECVVDELRACYEESKTQLSFRVCYAVLDTDELLALFTGQERDCLCARLNGAPKTAVFCATVGIGIDRLIHRYIRVSQTKGLWMQAIGAERVESLCDAFCRDLQKQYPTLYAGARFSAGYGNIPLTVQKTVFRLLDCERKIGVTLNDGGLMTPTKSVTAFVPLYTDRQNEKRGCTACGKTDCDFRRENA